MITPSSNNVTDLKSIGFNILGGVIVILLDRAYLVLSKKIKNYKLKQIFGKDIINNYKLIYGQFLLKPVYDIKGSLVHHPFIKQGSPLSHSILDPVSFSDTKAAKYISSLIAKETGKYAELVSDLEIGSEIDVSYCSTGGYSNFKSLEIMNSQSNTYYDFCFNSTGNVEGIINKVTKQKYINRDAAYDIAFIIKTYNRFFPKRVQICVAGFNIWGTSGAAWYLSHKWKDIYRLAGSKEFGIVLRVRKDNDQTAEIIASSIKRNEKELSVKKVLSKIKKTYRYFRNIIGKFRIRSLFKKNKH